MIFISLKPCHGLLIFGPFSLILLCGTNRHTKPFALPPHHLVEGNVITSGHCTLPFILGFTLEEFTTACVLTESHVTGFKVHVYDQVWS